MQSPDNIADSDVDSKDTQLRYAAYGARLRTALRAGHRYLAYVRLPPSRAVDDMKQLHRPVMSEKPSDPSYLRL